MTEDDHRRISADIRAALSKHASAILTPTDVANRIAQELNNMDPNFASCESVKVVKPSPDEVLIREVMEEPDDEIAFEASIRLVHPVQYILCHFSMVEEKR